MKAIFETKADSGYDDDISQRYHFPKTKPYMDVAQAAVGDWIVFRETRRNGGSKAYIAAAQVMAVEPDPVRADHAYARVANFQAFDRAVPFTGETGFAEQWLRDLPDPSRVGAAIQGKSMRPLAEIDFAAICSEGLTETMALENARRLELDESHTDQVTFDLLHAPLFEQQRRIEQILVNKKIRAASFRHHVLEAYEDRCAVTGLRIINGGGKPEAQAAHIWPVGEGGPDTVQNGIALSATVHWLFDRHLISLNEDYGLLVAHNRVPAELRPLFEQQMQRIHLPADERKWPYPDYVRRHRDRFASS